MKYGLTTVKKMADCFNSSQQVKAMFTVCVLATTCQAATMAAIGGPDLRWGGPLIIDDTQHDYSLDVVFADDFGSAVAQFGVPSLPLYSGVWQLTWGGMDESTRRFYSSSDGRSVVTLNGSDWDQLADDTFGQLVTTMGVEYWPLDVNPDNLVSKLTATATPVVAVVPEPSAMVLTLTGLCLTFWRRRA